MTSSHSFRHRLISRSRQRPPASAKHRRIETTKLSRSTCPVSARNKSQRLANSPSTVIHPRDTHHSRPYPPPPPLSSSISRLPILRYRLTAEPRSCFVAESIRRRVVHAYTTVTTTLNIHDHKKVTQPGLDGMFDIHALRIGLRDFSFLLPLIGQAVAFPPVTACVSTIDTNFELAVFGGSFSALLSLQFATSKHSTSSCDCEVLPLVSSMA